MDPIARRRVELATSCLEGEEREDYLTSLSLENPSDRQEIQELGTCFRDPARRSSCQPTTSYTPVSERAIQYCREMMGARQGIDSSLPFPGVRFAQTVTDSILVTPAYRAVALPDRQAINDILNRRTVLSFDQVARLLRSNPEWARRLSAYSDNLPPARIDPISGISPSAVQVDSLRVSGLPVSIPVLRRTDSTMPWRFVENDLLIHFEMLKVFFTPSDLSRLLRMGDASNPFYLAMLGPITFDQFSNGIDPMEVLIPNGSVPPDLLGGRNVFGYMVTFGTGVGPGVRDRLRNMPVEHQSARGALEAYFSNVTANWTRVVFLHEISHSIEYVLTRDHFPSGIRSLWRWASLQNLSTHRGENIPFHASPLLNTGVNPGALHGDGLSDYALSNPTEFLAHMAAEHIYYTFSENRPNTPEDRARRRIMDNFFSPTGVNFEAFSSSSIEAAYAAEGIRMSLDAASLREASLRYESEENRLRTRYQVVQLNASCNTQGTCGVNGRWGYPLAQNTHLGLSGSVAAGPTALLGVSISQRIELSRLWALEGIATGGISLRPENPTQPYGQVAAQVLLRPFNTSNRSPIITTGPALLFTPDEVVPYWSVGLGWDFLRSR